MEPGPNRPQRALHVAIRAPNWVGDLAMATPILEAALRTPGFARVSILVRRPLVPLLADGPLAERVVPVGGSADELARYRELAPDAALLLPNSLGAAWRAFRAGVPLRAGAALSGRRLLLTHAVRPPTRDGRRLPIPTSHLYRDVAGLLGIQVPDLVPRLAVREELCAEVRAELRSVGLEEGEPYALCCPGAAFGAAKLWPPERFAESLDRLSELRGLRGVVSGGPGEEPLMAEVAARSRTGALSLAALPRDLQRLKALVRGAALLLVGDSGPRWVAAAFGVPCVVVIGPTFPELTFPMPRSRILRVEGLDCAPCLERRCPLGHHRCMRELDSERVVAAALELLGATDRTPRAARPTD